MCRRHIIHKHNAGHGRLPEWIPRSVHESSQRDSNLATQGWRSEPDGRGTPTLGNRPYKFINPERVGACTRPPFAIRFNANYANHAKIKNKIPFAYLASFAVTAATPSELFPFRLSTQRSPTASANAGLNDTTPLELFEPSIDYVVTNPAMAGRALPSRNSRKSTPRSPRR